MKNPLFLFFLLPPILLLTHSQISGQERSDQKKPIGTRVWTDVTGKFSIEAKITSGNRKLARLMTAKDGSIIDIPVAKLSGADRKYVYDYCDAAFEQLKEDARGKALASDALKLYEDYVAKGFVDETNEVYVEAKLEQLKQEAERGSIIVGDQFIVPSELGSFRQKYSDLVSNWIDQSKVDDIVLLREACRVDPTSLEAGIMLALIFDLNQTNFKSADRRFDVSIKNAIRYLPVASDPEKRNLEVALNNYAVLNIRLGRVSKAMKLWRQVIDESASSAPSEVEFNVLKAHQMLQAEKCGLLADSMTKKKLGELGARCRTESYSTGGWRLMLPVDQSSQPRDGLEFLIANPKQQEFNGNYFEDARCVACSGSGTMPCTNKQCINGKIKELLFKYERLDMGGGLFKIIELPNGVRYHKCPTCDGQKRIECSCCSDGVQR